MSDDQSISVTRRIDADAQALFDVVADPSLHHVIDGSGSVRGVRGGSRKLAPGDRFSTDMRIGLPYRITNKVVEYEEGRRIAWAHVGGWRWRWEFTPVDGATDVTETFDWSTSRAGAYVRLMKWPERNERAMHQSLARLEAYVTNTSSPL